MRSTGPSASSAKLSQCMAIGSTSFRHASPSTPNSLAAASRLRSKTTAVPSSSGWASGASPWIQFRPWSANGSDEKKGEPAARGWTAEPKSCRNPGRVRGRVRHAPPGVGWASYTSTARPACASTMAPARPFGPEPMMWAVVGNLVGGFADRWSWLV